MAEILVKNWKMPENCYECPMMKNHLFHDGQKWQTGCFIERASNITFVEKRPSWCPLVEVEEVKNGEIYPLNRKIYVEASK